MKRPLALLVSAITLISVATPALAASFNATRWAQPRASGRAWKKAALVSYQKRWNLALRRAYYQHIVARILESAPTTLTVTGGGDRAHPDFQVVERPTARTLEVIARSSRD